LKACFFRRYGGPEGLEYGDVPDPKPAAGPPRKAEAAGEKNG